MNGERNNYYFILELSIDSPEENETALLEVIEKKRQFWSKNRDHPTRKREYQLYLSLVSDMKTVMTDRAKRQAELEAAREVKRQELRDRFRDLDELIGVMTLNGYVTEKQLKKLELKFSGISAQEIRKRITVPIRQEAQQPSKPQTSERLDETARQQIETNLAHLKKDSLYDFLGVNRSDGAEILSRRIETNNKAFFNEMRKDANFGASQELNGLCKVILLSETKRRQYDNELKLAALKKVDTIIDVLSADGELTAEKYNNLVLIASQSGADPADAGAYIRELCQKRNVFLTLPTETVHATMKQCACGIWNEPAAVNCKECGYTLEPVCPKCKTKNKASNNTCSKCSFAMGNMPSALKLLRDAKLAIAEGDWDDAAACLNKADVYWPGHAEISDLLKKAVIRQQEIADTAEALTEAVRKQRYYEAKRLEIRLRGFAPGHAALSCTDTVAKRIHAAETWLQKARAAGGSDVAWQCYSTALAECPDCDEAARALASHPPECPATARCELAGRTVSLTWQPSLSTGNITYHVIRKINSQPVSPDEGVKIAETTGTATQDISAEAGEAIYYAIYAVRGGVYSLRGTICGPVFLATDAENVEVAPLDNCISITWRLPRRAKTAEVWRKAGNGPVRAGEGEKVAGVRHDGVTDTAVSNGQSYSYCIVTVYEQFGRTVYSAGVSCQAKPMELPKPVKDMRATKRDAGFEFSWAVPPRGRVHLLQSSLPFNLSVGEAISVSRLSSLGTAIPVRGVNNAQWNGNIQGVAYVLPVTVEGDIAVCGQPVSVTSLPEVGQLKATVHHGKIYLEWQWPADIQEVAVAYSHEAYVADLKTNGARTAMITKQQYDIRGGFVLPAENEDYFFTVCTVMKKQDEMIYSSGQRYFFTNGPIKELYYELKLKRSFGPFGSVKGAVVLLRSNISGIKAPKMALVRKMGSAPARRLDGQVICRVLAETVVGLQPIEIEVPPEYLHENAYVRLFFTEDEAARQYQLFDPVIDKLRLG